MTADEKVTEVRARANKAIGGEYRMADGRAFWLDEPVVRAILNRIEDSGLRVVDKRGPQFENADRLAHAEALVEAATRCMAHAKRLKAIASGDARLTAELRAASVDLSGDIDYARAALEGHPDSEWLPMADADKNFTPVLGLLRDDIKEANGDPYRCAGLMLVVRHPGLSKSGFDPGWSLAGPFGFGGLPDYWFVGWRPLPPKGGV